MKHTLFSRTVQIACVKTHAIIRTRPMRFYACVIFDAIIRSKTTQRILSESTLTLSLFSRRHSERMSRDCKKFVCPDCDKKFKYESELNRHRRIHTGEKPFVCPDCFSRQRLGVNRIDSCNFELSSQGQLCITINSRYSKMGWAAMSNKLPGWHLANAWRSRSKHILQWRYRNEVSVHSFIHCDKMFTERGSLNVHRRIHTGEKPSACPDCGKKFRYSDTLLWINIVEFTLGKSRSFVLIVTSRSSKVANWMYIVEFTLVKSRSFVRIVIRHSHIVTHWLCIVEFTLVKSRSTVLIVTRSSNKVANWMYIVEFTLVKSRSSGLIVTRSSEIVTPWLNIVEFTLLKSRSPVLIVIRSSTIVPI